MAERAATWAFAIGLAVFALGGRASAQEQQATEPTGVLRVGKLYSFGGGEALEHGFGLDLRYRYYPEANLDGYFGLFSQGQYELGDAWRFAGGLTGGWGLVGLELGVAHRTATEDFAGSTGLHVGGSVSLGPVTLGGRLTLPLYDHVAQNVAGTNAVQGIEGAVTISLGFDFTLHGARRQSAGCHCQHGGRSGGHHGQ